MIIAAHHRMFGGQSVPTITADTAMTNALQVKTWIESICSARGLANVQFTLASAVDFVWGTNRVIAITVDNNGQIGNIVRQRTGYTYGVVIDSQMTSVYDTVIKVGDVFAIVG